MKSCQMKNEDKFMIKLDQLMEANMVSMVMKICTMLLEAWEVWEEWEEWAVWVVWEDFKISLRKYSDFRVLNLKEGKMVQRK